MCKSDKNWRSSKACKWRGYGESIARRLCLRNLLESYIPITRVRPHFFLTVQTCWVHHLRSFKYILGDPSMLQKPVLVIANQKCVFPVICRRLTVFLENGDIVLSGALSCPPSTHVNIDIELKLKQKRQNRHDSPKCSIKNTYKGGNKSAWRCISV